MALKVIAWMTDNNDWIGFWGGYLGGIFTLIGVVITIRHTMKEEKRKEKLLLRPYLSIANPLKKDATTDYDFGFAGNVSALKKESCYFYADELIIEGTFKNVGLGTAIQVKVKNIQLLNRNFGESTNTISAMSVGQTSRLQIDLLSVGVEKIDVPTDDNEFYYFDEEHKKQKRAFFKFDIEYEDLLGYKLRQSAIFVSEKFPEFPAWMSSSSWHLLSISKPIEIE